MRILEIMDKVSATYMSPGIYNELVSMEVDTVGEDSPPGKHHLADDMVRAVKKGNGYAVPLSDESINYLLDDSLPNLMDMADDAMNTRKFNAIKKFGLKLYNKHLDLDTDMNEAVAARIAHPEDLVWQAGGAGAKAAIDGLRHIAKDTSSITIKWDGTPALIFGRDPEDGQLVVTDKSGFGAKGYDGHAKSAEALHDMFLRRGADQPGRREFAENMANLWPLFEQMVPQNVRGYYQGDLLYTGVPPVVKGAYQFKPNKIEYRVPTDSELGQQIGGSQAGIVVHGFIPDRNSGVTPVTNLDPLRGSSAFLVFGPEMATAPKVKTPKTPSIDFDALNEIIDPVTLRQLKITDFGQQVGKYMASMARAGDGNYNDAAQGFLAWLRTAPVSEPKRENYRMWIANHLDEYNKMWRAIQAIHAFKTDIKNQIDTATGQSVEATLGGKPGHEGYVANTPFGVIKLVDRHEFMRD